MTKLTFLGTGTSQGVPVISCKCPVCTSKEPHDQRLRSSVIIEQGELRLIIDAGPDFRQQLLRERVERIDAILLTHEHKDHMGGLDEVRALNYTTQEAMPIYAEKRVQEVIRKDFDYAFGENKYPGAPNFELHTLDERPFLVKGVEVTPIRGMHFRLPVLGFRIGNVAYLTDFNHIEPSEIEKIKGVDIFVINALQKEPHISHFRLDEALAIREQVSPGVTYFTHISHQMGLHAEEQKHLPTRCFLAYDGLQVEA